MLNDDDGLRLANGCGFEVVDGRRVDDDGFVSSSKTNKSPGIYWCVSVKVEGDSVLVRDSKDLSKAVQSYTHDEWLAFLDGVKKGEFDLEILSRF